MKPSTAIPLSVVARKCPELFPSFVLLDLDQSGAIELPEIQVALRDGKLKSEDLVVAMRAVQNAGRWQTFMDVTVDAPLNLLLIGLEAVSVVKWPATLIGALCGLAELCGDTPGLSAPVIGILSVAGIGHVVDLIKE